MLAVPVAMTVAAQEPSPPRAIAKLKDVRGNVLVSKPSGLAGGADGTPLFEGTRIVTTGHSGAIVAYGDGCEVPLGENQRYQVDSGKPCSVLVSQVQSLLPMPSPVVPVAGIAGVAGLAVPAAAASEGLFYLNTHQHDRIVSPS